MPITSSTSIQPTNSELQSPDQPSCSKLNESEIDNNDLEELIKDKLKKLNSDNQRLVNIYIDQLNKQVNMHLSYCF